MSGKLYLGQKLYDAAEEQIRLAVEGDSTKAVYRAWWGIALCEVAKERLTATASIPDPAERIAAIRAVEPLYAEAHAQFANAAELDPDEMPKFCDENRVHYWVDGFKQAEALFRNHNYEESLAFLEELAVLDPAEPQGFLTMAYCLDNLHRPAEAVDRAQAAVEKAMAAIAVADCDKLRTKKARLDCTRRLEQHHQIVASVDDFLRSRNLVLGNAAFDASLSDTTVAGRRGHLGEALIYFEKSLALDPGLAAVRFRLGNSCFARAQTREEEGDTTRANPYFRRAAVAFLGLVDADSLPADFRNDALFNGKNALYAIRAWDDLLPWLLRTVDLEPEDPAAWRRLAECQAELKRPEEAVSSLMMYNALADNGVSIDPAAAADAARAEIEGEEKEALAELGAPEAVRSYREMDSGRTIVTWIWWSRGEVRHYVNGREVGALSFAPAAS